MIDIILREHNLVPTTYALCLYTGFIYGEKLFFLSATTKLTTDKIFGII